MVVELSSSKKRIDWDLLQSRYPSIAVELCFGAYEKISPFYDDKGFLNAKSVRGFLYSDDIENEMNQSVASLDLEVLDVLYVYGIGLGHFYRAIQSWLHKSPSRKIIFFEEDLSVLDALFEQEVGGDLLKDSQVHIYYVPRDEMWPDVLEECVNRWMSDQIEWTNLRSYFFQREKKIRGLRLKLLRRSACIHAKIAEALHYPMLMQNIGTNLLQVPSSFHANQLKGKFKNIPAIICGAGYSLGQESEHLKELHQKALIISGGSAITAMSHYRIHPHIAIAVDPNEEEYLRLRASSCFETPFIYSSRLHKEVLSSTNVQMGYLCSNTGGLFEAWMHEKLGIHTKSFALGLGEEALSVTTLATAFAVEMGCNPIIFCGVDLSYSNRQRYCPGVVSSSSVSLKELEKIKKSRDQMVRRKNVEGNYVYTLIKWVMEASCLGEFAKKQDKTSFFNLSSKGIPIPNAPVISWEELMKVHLVHDYDLKGKLQAETQETYFLKEVETVLKAGREELYLSFERSLFLFDRMIEEIQEKKEKVSEKTFSWNSGIISLIEMDLLEEPAYEVCFHMIFSVYQGILDWWTPSQTFEDSPEERLRFLEKKERLWKNGQKVARECLSFLKMN